ncbi:tetratricopeptide repeat protein [uncultured Ruegeria sp.]|uniref:tetratricopeptide repeat protein n=1 Tax=uncultured Ruegeria sp. TaxID=259304 RepID=UPI0026149D3D|nr:tetratricopeptide repeat protein [uncultured Ruegeria sp.]
MKNLTFCLTIGFSSFVGAPLHALTVSELEKNCLDGDLVSCENAGVAYEYGTDGLADYVKAAEFYNIGCIGGHGKACRRLSNLYVDGSGVPQSFDESWRLVHLACEKDDFFSCNVLGTTYERGFPLTPDSYGPPDPLRASEFYSVACEGNYEVSCSNLAALYAFGSGVTRNTDKAKSLYRKACDLGWKRGCEGLARLN